MNAIHRNGLRNCPFCGKHGTVAAILKDDGSTAVLCDQNRGTGGCGASTAPFPTKAQAVEAWNRRSSYIGKGDFERLGWPYNLVAEILGSDDELNGVELTEDQVEGLAHVIGTLTIREQECVLRRYRDGLSLDELAQENHVTRERVRQIIVKAERKLRHPTRTKYIKKGYEIASGEAAERARAEYQAEANLVKAQMLAEAQAEVQRIILEQTGTLIPTDGGEKRNPTLAEMDLSVRAYNCLVRALGSYATAAEVLQVKEPEKIRNLGRKSGQEVAYKLIELGFNITGTAWEPLTRGTYYGRYTEMQKL